MKRIVTATAMLLCFATVGAWADSVSFSTFVSNSSIASVTGNTGVIGYTYAGNKFVGSLYPNDGRLYSTNLSGGNVALFGTVPNAGGETVVAASLGQGGFAKGDIYAGSGANGNIYRFGNGGGSATLFATVPVGQVRSILFDPGNTFGGNMLVTTTTGDIYKITSTGAVTHLFSYGYDTEGMDVVGSTFGPHAGELLVASEGNGQVFLLSNTGVFTPVGSVGTAETVAYVPTNLGSGDPSLEGFYGANYPNDIIKADPSQFTKVYSQLGHNLIGDAIVTSETGHGIYDIHWNSGTSSFDPLISIGSYPDQPEDGIFVTAQRIQDINTTPEPGSIVLLGSGIAGIAGVFRRRRHR